MEKKSNTNTTQQSNREGTTPLMENIINQVGTKPRLTVELHYSIREWIPGREAVHIHKAEFSTLEVPTIEEAYSRLKDVKTMFRELDEENSDAEVHKVAA